MKIVFATNNAHKLQEVQQVLGSEFELITLRDCGVTEDIPENEPTLEGNALAKARYIYQRTGMIALPMIQVWRLMRWAVSQVFALLDMLPMATMIRPISDF